MHRPRGDAPPSTHVCAYGHPADTVPAELSVRPDLNRRLVPLHCEPELRARGIDLDNFVPIPLDQLKITLD
jgi:glycogen synthase kinase 3 beta